MRNISLAHIGKASVKAIRMLFKRTPAPSPGEPGLETWLASALDGLAPDVAADIRAELAAHFEDAVAAYVADGLPEDEARRRALTDLGDGSETGDGLRDVHLGWRRYLAAALVALIYPLVFSYTLTAELAYGLRVALYYPSILLTSVFLFGSLRHLLAANPGSERLTPALKGLYAGLVVGNVAPMISWFALEHYPIAESYIFIPGVGLAERALDYVGLAGDLTFGVSLALLATQLVRVEARLYRLSFPLAAACAVLGMCMLGIGTGIVSGAPFMALDFSLLAVLALNGLHVLLSLIFGQAAYRYRRPIAPPAQRA